MGTVVQLRPQEDEAFLRALRDAVEHLDDAADRLVTDIAGAALAGPLWESTRQQPVGTAIELDREVLRATGDPRLDALCDACDAMHDALERLAPYRDNARADAE